RKILVLRYTVNTIVFSILIKKMQFKNLQGILYKLCFSEDYFNFDENFWKYSIEFLENFLKDSNKSTLTPKIEKSVQMFVPKKFVVRHFSFDDTIFIDFSQSLKN